MPVNADVEVLAVTTNPVTVGVDFGATFRVTNTGSIPLDPAVNFKLGSQDPQDTTQWGLNRVALPQAIQPGGQLQFDAVGFIPQKPGAFQFAWRIVQEGIAWGGTIKQSILLSVNQGTGPPPAPTPTPNPSGLITAPQDVSKWPAQYLSGGLASIFILNTGPFLADVNPPVQYSASFKNDTTRTITLYKVMDWLGVDLNGQMDTQIYAIRASDQSFIFLSPSDHYANGSRGNFRYHDFPQGITLAPNDSVTLAWFARGFSRGVHAHYQTVLYYQG